MHPQCGHGSRLLTYEVIKADDLPGDQWSVQAWNESADSDGEGYFALFYGHDAERRARDYAGWMNEAPGLRPSRLTPDAPHFSA